MKESEGERSLCFAQYLPALFPLFVIGTQMDQHLATVCCQKVTQIYNQSAGVAPPVSLPLLLLSLSLSHFNSFLLPLALLLLLACSCLFACTLACLSARLSCSQSVAQCHQIVAAAGQMQALLG